jgi:hypothetical protein
MKQLIKYILIAGLLFIMQPAKAQLYNELLDETEKIHNVYADTGYTSLTMRYFYATEKKPAKNLDSLTFLIKCKGNNYFSTVGKVIYLQNKDYLVTVYLDNELIVISNPVKRQKEIMPVAEFDSGFLATQVDTAWITTSGNNRTIKFRFTDESNYNTYSIAYNKLNYNLQKIVYTLKPPPSSDTAVTNNLPYISILFSGYSKAKFDTAIFNISKYVEQLIDGSFQPKGIFANYRIINNYYPPEPEEALDTTTVQQSAGILHLNKYCTGSHTHLQENALCSSVKNFVSSVKNTVPFVVKKYGINTAHTLCPSVKSTVPSVVKKYGNNTVYTLCPSVKSTVPSVVKKYGNNTVYTLCPSAKSTVPSVVKKYGINTVHTLCSSVKNFVPSVLKNNISNVLGSYKYFTCTAPKMADS